jgi:hypothetical protein
MESEKDYRPPGWLTTWCDQVRLDPERAQKFYNLRVKLCESLGKSDETCNVNNLWIKALDLLLASEETK